MKNYRKSDYALNKFSEGIVYQFSDGTLEISMADYLRDNPSKTEADFLELKALSDEIYLEQARLETAQGNKTVSMTGLEDAVAHPAPALGDSIIMADEQRRVRLAVDKAGCLEISALYSTFFDLPSLLSPYAILSGLPELPQTDRFCVLCL